MTIAATIELDDKERQRMARLLAEEAFVALETLLAIFPDGYMPHEDQLVLRNARRVLWEAKWFRAESSK